MTVRTTRIMFGFNYLLYEFNQPLSQEYLVLVNLILYSKLRKLTCTFNKDTIIVCRENLPSWYIHHVATEDIFLYKDTFNKHDSLVEICKICD